MAYLIYGKRTLPIEKIVRGKRYVYGPDKTFRALDYQGRRVVNLNDAGTYATREDAQERIDKATPPAGVILEIRKAR